MGGDVESRFERYAEVMVEALGHADRATPARWYLRGLMLQGERKSVEPMAARVHPQDVRSAHQSMHHLVADSEWSDTALLGAVAREVVPVLSEGGEAPLYWVVDDTGFRKYGKHSVGVARQYCGQLGKTENCQVAVTLSLCTPEGSLPLDYRLYLPREWAEDKERCKRAGVPPEIGFATKGKLAWAQIEAALRARGAARHRAHGCGLWGRSGDARPTLCPGPHLRGRHTPADGGVVGRTSTGACARHLEPGAAPHPRATRSRPSADQRSRSRPEPAGFELSFDHVA
jgi:hypothetical protein